MFISLHTPKTAGSSFKRILRSYFGDSLLEEYIDFPLHYSKKGRIGAAVKSKILFNLYRKNNFDRVGIECIHGHFLPLKYTGPAARGFQYITWLRDPLERICSHYYYWHRTYKEGKSSALHSKMIKENWTLEEFCFCDELRNIYQQFLWQFPIEKFDFIGITEHFDEDLRYFSEQFLQLEKLDIPTVNVNTGKHNNLYQLNENVKDEIRKFHERDYEIYNYALSEREKRINSTSKRH